MALRNFNEKSLTGCGYLLSLAARRPAMRDLFPIFYLGIAISLVALSNAAGQVAESPQATGSSDTQLASQAESVLQTYSSQQQVLMQQRQALIAQGATPQQLKAWFAQNSSIFAIQQQQAQAMAAVSSTTTLPVSSGPVIPTDASSSSASFLTTKANLAKAEAQLHNRMVQLAGTNPSAAKITQMQQQQTRLFLQQEATLLAQQKQQISAVALTPAQMIQAVPANGAMPRGVTSQETAFFAARNQLRQQEIALSNQYASATPAVRAAALQKWRKQNAAQFAQLQEQAQSLSDAIPTQGN